MRAAAAVLVALLLGGCTVTEVLFCPLEEVPRDPPEGELTLDTIPEAGSEDTEACRLWLEDQRRRRGDS